MSMIAIASIDNAPAGACLSRTQSKSSSSGSSPTAGCHNPYQVAVIAPEHRSQEQGVNVLPSTDAFANPVGLIHPVAMPDLVALPATFSYLEGELHTHSQSTVHGPFIAECAWAEGKESLLGNRQIMEVPFSKFYTSVGMMPHGENGPVERFAVTPLFMNLAMEVIARPPRQRILPANLKSLSRAQAKAANMTWMYFAQLPFNGIHAHIAIFFTLLLAGVKAYCVHWAPKKQWLVLVDTAAVPQLTCLAQCAVIADCECLWLATDLESKQFLRRHYSRGHLPREYSMTHGLPIPPMYQHYDPEIRVPRHPENIEESLTKTQSRRTDVPMQVVERLPSSWSDEGIDFSIRSKLSAFGAR